MQGENGLTNGYANLLSTQNQLPQLLKAAYKKYGGEKSYEELLDLYLELVLGSRDYQGKYDVDDDYLDDFKSRVLERVYNEKSDTDDYRYDYRYGVSKKYNRNGDENRRIRPKHVIYIDDDENSYKDNDYKPKYRPSLPAKYQDDDDDRESYKKMQPKYKSEEDDEYGARKYDRDDNEVKKYDDEDRYASEDDDYRRKSYMDDDDDRKYNSVTRRRDRDDDDDDDEKYASRKDNDKKPRNDDDDDDDDDDKDDDKKDDKDDSKDDDNDDLRNRRRKKPSPYDLISDSYLVNELDSVSFDLDRRIKDNFGYPEYAPFYVGRNWINEHMVPFYKSMIKYVKDTKEFDGSDEKY